MNLWAFLRSESDIPGRKLLLMAAVSGFSNALLLALVNAAAHYASEGQTPPERGHRIFLFVAFIVTILLYIVSQRYILRVANMSVERMVNRLRVRIADKIRKGDLLPLEMIGKAEIYSIVSRDTQIISQAARPSIVALQSAIMIVFTMIYIAWLKPLAFWLTVVIIAAGVVIHFRRLGEMMKDIHEASARENEFFAALTHLLEGFKQVKIHTPRSNDLYRSIEQVGQGLENLKIKTGRMFADHFIFSQTTFYLLIGTMVFVVPTLTSAYSDVVTRITAAILFIIGPLTALIGTIPTFSSAQVAVQNIQQLESRLDQLRLQARDKDEMEINPPVDFREIQLSKVVFSYRDSQGAVLFQVGPIDLTIPRGELLFIVGGNGSGKSTFLKLLTALYYPESGMLQVDGKNIADMGYSSYRNLFSTIFTDYHLFDQLFGLGAVSDEQVARMLEDMKLSEKTQFTKGRFLNQDLSTGQRKRLALIVSLLEDRPVCIFDEWAADQDPSFREHFYRHILPDLKRQGKTVIAATHDDRYFGVADRVLKMENGMLLQPGQ